MISFFKTPLFAAILGAILFLATTVMFWPSASPQSNHDTAKKTQIKIEPAPSWKFENPDMNQLIVELKKEKEAFATRQQELQDMETRLANERAEINNVLSNIHRMQNEFDLNVKRFQSEVNRVKEEEQPNLKKLAKVYASMAPDAAASVFKEMEDDNLVKILAFMKESETSPILEIMAQKSDVDAKRVATISDRLRLTLTKPSGTKTRSP